MSYIYAHRKNSEQEIISFINQISLLYIEFNNVYSFEFNTEEKEEEFEFRIRVLRTNIKGSYKINITYDSENSSLEKEKDIQIFKHKKSSDSKLKIKIAFLSQGETGNKGFILEIFKSIDIVENENVYLCKEADKSKLEKDKVILFLYDKEKINSEKNNITFYNNENNKNISLCIHRSKGKYPFIIKPICSDDQEKIIIKPNDTFTLTYNNPYDNEKDDNENQFYISISTDRQIYYSYKYKKEIDLEENKYIDLNHKGYKIFKLSKKINQKKSIYYQINLCRNKNKNSFINYSINQSEPYPIKNTIYQEFSLNSIKSYFIEFNSEKAGLNSKFKYFYGPDNILKTLSNFSSEIVISKNAENNRLLIKFETPFTGIIDISIILIADFPDEYDDFCSLMKFYENYKSEQYNNSKIFSEKIRMKDCMKNKIEISLEKSEIMDFMNKNVDIYVITKSVESNLDLIYDVKMVIFDWYKLNNSENDLINEYKN